jgi:hypothetical protein
VRVRGGTEEEQTIFHTAMFHAAMMPRRQDDVDGRYRGLDREVHVTDHPYYSDMSLWDTFRTVHPWYILAWPEVELDMARSLARMTRDGGSLPRWPIGHGYTGGMVGTPAGQVLAETWLKGIQDFDVDTAFAAAVATSRGPVPYDAIEQFAVRVAPFDISEGDFQGGAINEFLRVIGLGSLAQPWLGLAPAHPHGGTVMTAGARRRVREGVVVAGVARHHATVDGRRAA